MFRRIFRRENEYLDSVYFSELLKKVEIIDAARVNGENFYVKSLINSLKL